MRAIDSEYGYQPAEPASPPRRRRPGRPRSALHGTRSMYGRHRCRCDSCVQANRDYQRRWYFRRRLELELWHRRAGELYERARESSSERSSDGS